MNVRREARTICLGTLIGALALAAPAGRAEEAGAGSGKDGCCHGEGAPKGPAPRAREGERAQLASYSRSERVYAPPDVTLVDAGARPVRLRELLAADEPVMLNFVFTTCTAICPVMSRIFARVPEELGREAERLRLVSISIDPEHDTPERLRGYARRFGAGPRWSFLTGSAADVEAVERAFDAFRGDKMNHEPLTLLRAAPGRPWVRLDGFASPAELAREYRRVMGEVALR